jgi:hypothetical protein
MTRERLSSLLRWAAIVAGGCLLLVVLGARAPAGPLRRDVAGPIYLSAPGAHSSVMGHTVAEVAGPRISGPYTSTTPAFTFDGGVRNLPHIKQPAQPDRPEVDSGQSEPGNHPAVDDPVVQSAPSGSPTGPNMPSPIQNFAGLDHLTWGAGYPPDTNGDVGPNDFVQTVNTSIGIFSKTGTQLAALTFNTLFSGAATGTACDADNQGDPVALYDAQADRFIVTDFAFTNTTQGPFYECIAASLTGDPVAGGWRLYALRTDDDAHKFLADYPKVGVWPDGIYMSVNMFDCSITCNGNYQGTRVWALNRNDLYGGPTLHAVYFDTTSAFFSLLPSNFRGAAPPAGRPNFFVSNDAFVYALDVFQFHVDWTTLANSTFTGPTQITIASFASPPDTVPEPAGGNNLDSLGYRLMMQNHYRNINGTESLWVTHTAGKSVPNITGVRWYQLNVTGGIIATTNPVQQSTFRPDATHRWMPSLAVDKFGDMAVGYSASSSSIFPAIRYAGRLAGDPANILSQGETTLIAGTGAQTNNCGSGACTRWGDYSAMTVDPVDDCTFWYTTEYYTTSGGNWQTRIGSFKFPACGVVFTNYTYLPMVQDNAAAAGSWTNIVQEGFEGTWPGASWSVNDNGTNTHEFWGKGNCHANAGSFSAWAIGGGSVGSGLTCGANYPDNEQSWMVYGPFSLAGATAAQFNLQLWLNSELNFDAACIMASIDNNNFSGNCISGNSGNAFVPESLDLSSVFSLGDLRGQSNVWVTVIFTSDYSVNLPEGAFVDDLLLRKCTVASCPSLASGQASTNNGQLQSYRASLTRPTNVTATGLATP